MSLAVDLQRFRRGQPAPGDGHEIRTVPDPFIAEAGDTWANRSTADGGAEVYGIDDLSGGFMFTRREGRAIWDLVFEVARAGGFVGDANEDVRSA